MRDRKENRKSLEKEHERVFKEYLNAKKYCDFICKNNLDINCYGEYPNCILHFGEVNEDTKES